MKYTYIKNDDSETIVALIDGDLYSITNEHPCWDDVRWKCSEGTATPEDFDMEDKVVKYLELSNKVTIDNGVLYFNGEAMHSVLAEKIISDVSDGVDAKGLVNFMEWLAENPSRNSRDQLFTWLDRSGFEITELGYIVGYKSVYATNDGYRSVSSGTAFVNGEEFTGQIPQKPGDIVAMHRSDVTDNPAVGCSYGLHVGTLGYAQGFSGDTIIKVLVSPTDVVSVPDDCNGTKMRVCCYSVVGKYEEPAVTVEEEYVFKNSSFLNSATFDGNTLTVAMQNGKSYEYPSNVYIWNDLIYADENGKAGEYYNYYVKG